MVADGGTIEDLSSDFARIQAVDYDAVGGSIGGNSSAVGYFDSGDSVTFEYNSFVSVCLCFYFM